MSQKLLHYSLIGSDVVWGAERISSPNHGKTIASSPWCEECSRCDLYLGDCKSSESSQGDKSAMRFTLGAHNGAFAIPFAGCWCSEHTSPFCRCSDRIAWPLSFPQGSVTDLQSRRLLSITGADIIYAEGSVLSALLAQNPRPPWNRRERSLLYEL